MEDAAGYGIKEIHGRLVYFLELSLMLKKTDAIKDTCR